MLLTVARTLSKFIVLCWRGGVASRLVKSAEWPYDTALFPSRIRSLHGQHRISQKARPAKREAAPAQREPALRAAHGRQEREEGDRGRRQGGGRRACCRAPRARSTGSPTRTSSTRTRRRDTRAVSPLPSRHGVALRIRRRKPARREVARAAAMGKNRFDERRLQGRRRFFSGGSRHVARHEHLCTAARRFRARRRRMAVGHAGQALSRRARGRRRVRARPRASAPDRARCRSRWASSSTRRTSTRSRCRRSSAIGSRRSPAWKASSSATPAAKRTRPRSSSRASTGTSRASKRPRSSSWKKLSTAARSRRSPRPAAARCRPGFEPLLAGFVRVPFDDLEAVRRVAANNRNVVAVLVELIQGEGGINVCSDDYLAGLRAICDENKWLLMLDEVQSGTGRTGKWFAFQHSGVKPDVVTLAKGLGNGVPIGTCMAAGAGRDALQAGQPRLDVRRQSARLRRGRSRRSRSSKTTASCRTPSTIGELPARRLRAAPRRACRA